MANVGITQTPHNPSSPGPSPGPPSPGPPSPGPPPDSPPPDRPKFRAFFSISRHNVLSFFPLLGVFTWNFGGVFEGRGPQMCTFGLSGCRVKHQRGPDLDRPHPLTDLEKQKDGVGNGFGQSWYWPNLVWSKLVLAKFRLAKVTNAPSPMLICTLKGHQLLLLCSTILGQRPESLLLNGRQGSVFPPRSGGVLGKKVPRGSACCILFNLSRTVCVTNCGSFQRRVQGT